MTGQVLGPYKILSKLGEGGMGVVYRATDERLGRDVAIKVLPETFARDRERMARFEREARTLASLNHPNIAQLYGVEQGALVLELVEGERLRCPVPIETAIAYALQIVDALEHAHEKGVIHRDLKPGNLRVTPDGQVKVLDFGLAKAMEVGSAPAAANPEDSPTLTVPMSSAGVIVGTASYMSPEQARGARVDHRTDIWAFGVVLYEMVTGRSPFKGETVTDTLAAVLGKEPDLDAVPERVRGLVRRCLERDLRKRLGWIGEARGMLDAPSARPHTSPRRWWIIPAVAAGMFAAGWMLRVPKPVEQPLRAFSFTPESLSNTDYVRRAVISPNGKHIAYAAANKLWIRDLESERARAIDGSENAEGPFWSPDSSSVAFAAAGDLKKVAVAGGTPFALARLPGRYRGGAWSPDGLSILFSIGLTGLFEVPAAGGTLKRVATAEGGIFYSPQFVPSPAGERWVVAGKGRRTSQTIEWIDLKTGKSESLHAGRYPVYSSSGHILFQADPSRPGLWALELSPRTGRPEGEPVPVLNRGSDFSTSIDGTLVWADSLAALRVPVWRDRAGKKLGAAGPAQSSILHLSLSPDGTRLAYTADEQGNSDIWILDLKRAVRTRFTFAPDVDGYATWTPSGKEIAFSTIRRGNADIFLQQADGSGEPRWVISGPLREYPTAWSPDGRILLFQWIDRKTGYDIWFARRKPDGSLEEPAPFLQSSNSELSGQFSPDGRYVLYSSDESGRTEVYVRSFPDGAGKRQVSTQGGDNGRWSRDGKEVFYLNGDALLAVPVSLEGSFPAGDAVELFRTPALQDSFISYQYEVAPDGKRFLVAEDDDSGKTPSAAIHVVLNWTALLRKKAPAPAPE